MPRRFSRVGKNCRDRSQAFNRRPEIGPRDTPVDDDSYVIGKKHVMAKAHLKQSPIRTKNGPKQSPLPKPGRRNR